MNRNALIYNYLYISIIYYKFIYSLNKYISNYQISLKL